MPVCVHARVYTEKIPRPRFISEFYLRKHYVTSLHYINQLYMFVHFREIIRECKILAPVFNQRINKFLFKFYCIKRGRLHEHVQLIDNAITRIFPTASF